MQERRSKKIFWFLLISLLLHFFILMWGIHKPTEPEKKQAEALDVEILKTPKRIADIAPPKKEKRPEKADFIGLYDSQVKEQQVARTPPQPPGVPQPQQAPQEPQPPETPQEVEKPKSLKALFAMKKEQARKEQARKSKQTARKTGIVPEDFYPDYKVGAHTYLNVLRFPNVQYFVRLKRIFKMTFNPIPILRNFAISRQVSRGHVEVVLGVVVDGSGRLARLFVIRGSGFREYDGEALRTVRDSSPFAKPPSNLLGPDGKLRMSWTFTVYL